MRELGDVIVARSALRPAVVDAFLVRLALVLGRGSLLVALSVSSTADSSVPCLVCDFVWSGASKFWGIQLASGWPDDLRMPGGIGVLGSSSPSRSLSPCEERFADTASSNSPSVSDSAAASWPVLPVDLLLEMLADLGPTRLSFRLELLEALEAFDACEDTLPSLARGGGTSSQEAKVINLDFLDRPWRHSAHSGSQVVKEHW